MSLSKVSKVNYTEALSKKYFGSEPKFTRDYLSNPNSSGFQSLNELIYQVFGWDINDEGFKIIPEDRCKDGSRIDISVYYNEECICVIEAQDAKGAADKDHVVKLVWYNHDKAVDKSILICESIDNEFIKLIENKFLADDIYVVKPVFITDGKNTEILEWVTLYSPESMSNKIDKMRIQSAKSQNSIQPGSDAGVRKYVSLGDLDKSKPEDPKYTLWKLKTPKGETHIQIHDKDQPRAEGKVACELSAIKYCNSAKFLELVDFDYTKLTAEFVMSSNNREEILNKRKELKS